MFRKIKERLFGSQEERFTAIWTEAFSLGFSKAWDMMVPLMTSGIDKSKEAIFNLAIDQAMANLEPVIQKRIEDAGKKELIPVNRILAKEKELVEQIAKAKKQEDKVMYSHSLQIVRSMLNGNSISKG